MSVVVQPLNRVISDSSFFETFGRLPNETDSEDIRISTHLNYVYNTLQKQQQTSLNTSNPKIIKNRNVNLNYLNEYIQNNKFPKRTDNFKNTERIPVFRDDFGTYCAVGYMMHKNGLNLESVINSDFNYGYLNNHFIDSFPKLKQWINNCGLSVRELQCIQPTYSFEERDFLELIKEDLDIPKPEVKESEKLPPKKDEKKKDTKKKINDKSDSKSPENEKEIVVTPKKESKNKNTKKKSKPKQKTNNKRPPKNKYDKSSSKSSNKSSVKNKNSKNKSKTKTRN